MSHHLPVRRLSGALLAVMRHRRRVHVLVLLVCVLAACQPVEVAPLATGLPRTQEVRTLSTDAFLIDYPRNGFVDTLPSAAGARFTVRISGPEMRVGLPEGSGSWEGLSYELEIAQLENPAALTAEAWVRERVLSGRVQHVRDTSSTRVSGRSAMRVRSLAGDALISTVYVPRDRQMVLLRYPEHLPANQPAAAAAIAVQTMMLGSFRYREQ